MPRSGKKRLKKSTPSSRMAHLRGELAEHRWFIVVWLGFAVFVFLNLLKYPVFPQKYSVDFISHLATILGLKDGTVAVKWLYSGVHLFMAPFVREGATAIVDFKIAALALVVLSPPVVYLASHAMYGRKTALITTILYVLASPLWFYAAFDTGLLPNFFAIVVGFALLYLLKADYEPKKEVLLLGFGVAVALSHYSILALLLSIVLIVPWIENRVRRRLLITCTPTLFGVAFLIIRGDPIIEMLRATVMGEAGFVVIPSMEQSMAPLWRDLVFLHSSPYLTVLIVVLVAIGALSVRRGVWYSLPVLWCGLILSVALLNPQPLRFLYIALQPILLLSGIGLSFLFDKIEKKKTLSKVLGCGIAILLLYGTHTAFLIDDIGTSTAEVRAFEFGVNEAICYIGKTYPGDQAFILVYEWRFLFLRTYSFINLIDKYPTEAGDLSIFAMERSALVLAPSAFMKIGDTYMNIAKYYVDSGLFEVKWENQVVKLLEAKK